MASRQIVFALAYRDKIAQLADIVVSLNELNSTYFASGYNSGGSDEIQDSDLEGHSLVAADIADMSTATTNLELLLGNGAPARGDYWSLINVVRNVG